MILRELLLDPSGSYDGTGGVSWSWDNSVILDGISVKK